MITSSLCLFSKHCIGYVCGLQYGHIFLGATLNLLVITYYHCYEVNGQIAAIHELTEYLFPISEISFPVMN